MKHRHSSLALVAVAAILAAGCEKETNITVDNTPVAARITSTIDAMTTRASGTTWAVGDAIGITTETTGQTRYTNIKYIATTPEGYFYPTGNLPKDTIFFWDNVEVTFNAYYPYVGKNGEVPGTNGVLTKIITATDQTKEGQPKIDYLFATATIKGLDNYEVKLPFKHHMSRIVLNFVAYNGMVSLNDFTYTVTRFPLEGTFNTTTGETKGTKTGDLNDLPLTVPSGATTISSTLIVFPMEMSATPTHFSILMNNRVYKGKLNFPQYPDNSKLYGFRPGYSYSYNVRVSNNKLTINLADIENWEESNGGNVYINN